MLTGGRPLSSRPGSLAKLTGLPPPSLLPSMTRDRDDEER
jgi:hypothetical protein